jgi:hypothetical protein
MKKIIVVTIIGALFFVLTGCPLEQGGINRNYNHKAEITGNYTYKTECLGIDADGTQKLSTWGNGRNRFEAIKQAKKNVVRDILFKGIIEGKNVCDPKPIVTEVNAQERYESYFYNFFADGGEYQKYVWLLEDRPRDRVFPDRATVTYNVILKVQRIELKQKMIADGILQ